MTPKKQRILATALAVLALVIAATGAVYAYLSATTGSVNNTLTPAPEHTVAISEEFENQLLKEDVCVDVGDPGYAVYVRVAVVATWQKELSDGSYVTHWQMPVQGNTIGSDGDYYMVVTDNWFYKDGYYYLKTPQTGGTTPVVFQRCYQMNEPPDAGYQLHIEIVAQTIQALGSTDSMDADGNPIPAVTDAWGVTVDDDGKLVVPTT